MSRKEVVFTSFEDGAKKPCDWNEKDNCGVKHDFKVDYPKGGKVKRGGWPGTWDRTNSHLNGVSISLKKPGPIKIFFPKKGTSQNETWEFDFPVQKHHVVPVACLKSGVDKLANNLELIGWVINNGDYNGISLPFNYEDMCRYDLQTHRTCHPEYNHIVSDALKEIEGASETYCKDKIQDELWNDMDELVDYLLNCIVDWAMILRPQSLLLRHVDPKFMEETLSSIIKSK